MTLFEALKAARQWGDTVQFADGRIVVTKAEAPHYGIIVSVPTLTVPDGKPRDADVKRVWKTASHFGPDMEAGMKGARLVLSHPDRGQATVTTAPAALTVPTAPEGGWATLTPVVLSRVQQAALAASSDQSGGWGMNGVRLHPSYVAATDSQIVVVVWSATGVTDPVTLPVEGVKRLPTDTDTDFAVTPSQGWFRAGDCTYWTALVATPWPDSVVTDVIPQRRDADSLTIDLPEGWADAVKGAALTDHDADNPAVMSSDDMKLSLTIPRVFERHWELPGMSQRDPVGVNAHLLLKATKLLPADEAAYLSVADPLKPVMLYTAGTDAVEVLVSTHYLPR